MRRQAADHGKPDWGKPLEPTVSYTTGVHRTAVWDAEAVLRAADPRFASASASPSQLARERHEPRSGPRSGRRHHRRAGEHRELEPGGGSTAGAGAGAGAAGGGSTALKDEDEDRPTVIVMPPPTEEDLALILG